MFGSGSGAEVDERAVDRRADGPVWDSGRAAVHPERQRPGIRGSRRLRSFLEKLSIGTSYIEPGSPWQNGYVESFHSRFRDECLALEEFETVREAIEVVGRWRQSYNHRRPHSSLGGLTPAEFSSRCVASVSEQASATPQPAPALQQPTADPFTQPLPS